MPFKMSIKQCALLTVALGGLGCGATTIQPIDAAPDVHDSSTTGDGYVDSSYDGVIPPEGRDTGFVDTGLVVDGGSDCGLADAGALARETCCNGVPCIGDCVELEPGKNACWCFGVPGGCTGGLICCTLRPAACASRAICGS